MNQQGLYRSEFEHDACGVGMVANLSGEASHEIVTSGMTILKRLMHRGATGNDPETGDGAGLLLKIPHGFFRHLLAAKDARFAKDEKPFGVAMIFGGDGEEAKIEGVVRDEGCEVLAWRDVPTDPSAIGKDARKVMPRIRQLFLAQSEGVCRDCGEAAFERRLYIVRRQIEKVTEKTYVCSCSSRTVVYKGLLLATQIEKFYPDLSDPDFVSPFAIVHQRYSTNTFPSWELAHPFRAIAHNGEINALKGNLNALAAREASLASPLFGDELGKVLPIVHGGQSDSASLDNIFELLVAAGRDAPHAMMMLIPQAWGAKYHMGNDVRAFCEYHSALMEPWDGPAAVAFTDGISLGAALDRNGLRPARWTLTKDGLFVLASETGVLDIAPERVLRHGRLRPGSLVWLDLTKHRLMEDAEVKTLYARRQPYRRWVRENRIPVTGLFSEIVPSRLADGDDGKAALQRDRQRFGWTLEDVELILRPMAETGAEPVGAMGNDAALAALRGGKCTMQNAECRMHNAECTMPGRTGSFKLFDFFHQLFAQVTNPPIDPIREELVMSIMTYIGNQGNILSETPEHAHLVKMTRPVLTDDELNRMRNIPDFPAKTLALEVEGRKSKVESQKSKVEGRKSEVEDQKSEVEDQKSKVEDQKSKVESQKSEVESQKSGGWLQAALDRLASDALAAVRDGAKIIILSDRPYPSLVTQAADDIVARIPSLLAVAAVNKALANAGVRPSVGIVVESGEVREVNDFAVLLGFGATAINPYLALGTVSEIGKADPVKATANYVSAVCHGIMKIMSKMGISTLRSYRSAKIFEAVGLGPRLMREYFGGVVSPVGGLELEDIEERIVESRRSEVEGRRSKVEGPKSDVEGQKSKVEGPDADNPSTLQPFNPSTLQPFNPSTITSLPPGGEYRYRKEGVEHLWTPQRITDFRESVRNDDYARFHRYTDSIDNESGITLRSQLEFREEGTGKREQGTEEVESIIRHFVGGAMSMGSLSPEAHETIALALNGLGTMSNSGEGGEDPARFGTDRNSAIKQVASARFGVTIEYLRSAKDIQIKMAQGAKPGEGGQLPGHKVNELVGRLRHAKPGTTLISPPPHHDIYSIEDLAQLIYDLKCANPDARVSVKLVSEAGVGTIAAGVAKAHADVVVISGFDGGTGAAPLTSMKHAGLPWEAGLAEAHQTLVRNNLRHRVKLQVDGQLRTGRDIVVAAMLGADEFAFGTSMLVSLGCVQCRNCNLNCCPVGIATQKEELRAKFAGKPEHLQRYFRFLAEEVREVLASLGLKSLAEARGRADLLKAKDGCRFDFGDVLALAGTPETPDVPKAPANALADNYDARELIPVFERGGTVLDRAIANRDRSVGAALSGWLVASGGSRALRVNFAGTAGQSFGAFLHRNVSFHLDGEANDYVGKGLSGGTISITGNVGNVIAYGATSGSIFIGGTAGERFGIRNSGATLVVEGVGDHGCEYMTGGTAVVLGPTGVNFGAGMTGGVAYVLDEAGTLDLNCNLESVDLFPVEEGSADEKALLAILRKHIAQTGSPLAERLVKTWANARPLFAKVVPVQP